MDDITEYEHGNIRIQGTDQQIDGLLGPAWDGSLDITDFSSDRTVVLREDVIPVAYGRKEYDGSLADEEYAARDLMDMVVLDDYVDMNPDVVFDDSEMPRGLQGAYRGQTTLLNEEAEVKAFRDDDELVGYAANRDAIVVTTDRDFNEEYGEDVDVLPPSAAAVGYKLTSLAQQGHELIADAFDADALDY